MRLAGCGAAVPGDDAVAGLAVGPPDSITWGAAGLGRRVSPSLTEIITMP